MKKRSQRYDIIRPRPRHGAKYTKYRMYFSITPKQHSKV